MYYFFNQIRGLIVADNYCVMNAYRRPWCVHVPGCLLVIIICRNSQCHNGRHTTTTDCVVSSICMEQCNMVDADWHGGSLMHQTAIKSWANGWKWFLLSTLCQHILLPGWAHQSGTHMAVSSRETSNRQWTDEWERTRERWGLSIPCSLPR